MDRHLGQVLHRTHDVELEWLLEDGSKNKINGIRLTPPQTEGQDTQLTAEELCQVMLAMANIHAEEDEAEDPRNYRAKLHWKDDKGKPHRKFWKFLVNPPGHNQSGGVAGRQAANQDPYDQHSMDESSTRMEYQQRSFERQQRMAGEANSMIMRQVESTLNTILRAHTQSSAEQRLQNEENRIALRESREQTNKAQDRLFKMALTLTTNNEQQEQMQQKAMEMFTMGWQWYMHSMTQQLVFQERRHREEFSRLREQKKEDGRWSWVGEFAPVFLSFGGAVLSHFGMPIGDMMQHAGAEQARAAQEAAMDPNAQRPAQEGPPSGFEDSPPPGFAPPSAPPPAPPTAPPGAPTAQAADAGAPHVEQPPPPPVDPSSLTLAEKARRFGEVFPAAAWQTLREGMSPTTFGALQAFVTSERDGDVGPRMMVFTAQLQMHPAEDQCLNSVLSPEQMSLANAIMGQLQSQQGAAPGGGAPPAPARPPAPSPPPQPSVPQPPAAPKVPAGFEPPGSVSEAHGGPGVSPKQDGDGGAAAQAAEEAEEDALEELRALLASVRGLAPSARNELEAYGSVASLHGAEDTELLGIAGVGPVVLRRLRDELGK
jgi:hypothetical protein